MKKNKKKTTLTTVEAVKKSRGSWGNVKPFTRIMPNGKGFKRHPKHKGKEDY